MFIKSGHTSGGNYNLCSVLTMCTVERIEGLPKYIFEKHGQN
jgi:hypothetical protein